MDIHLDKVYEPQRFEPHWAKWWAETNLFHAEARRVIEGGERYFSLVIPPPNVTGALHIGHMFEHSIIDAQVRWRRMLGVNTLWLPGTDHAGISTQIMVERQLKEEGLTRHDLGREKFEARVWEWKEQYGGRILEQMKRAGVSVDWTRLRFTLDPGLSRAVREAFVRLYEKGLIYRGEYMVNWCPRCQTALSDLEAIAEETDGFLWHIRYPVIGSDAKLVVATTRPETMLGDTAVAINPKDPRAGELAGRDVKLPLTERAIPIVLDEMAELGFGSGAVKITPAHDPNDFEAGKRHNLPSIKVIDENGQMTANAGAFVGLDRFEARKRVVEELERLGLMEKIEPYKVNLRKCQRCKTIVEPLVSMQWWARMKPLAEPAIKAVEDGRITFVPANWAKTYFEWMYNIRDWCISRQLWWGHRIPAWHCVNGHVTVARETPAACATCGSAELTQDKDVLDTWFSSGLWPFSTLGWPDDTADLRAFYPTTLLVTGFDIIFFWAARMIMLGMEMTGEVPFRQVHIHGLVRDAERQKISKTKGNVIDPLVINDKYGTDAVRFALLVSAAPGADIALSEERIDAERAFANKIWNASRLLFSKPREGSSEPSSIYDRWIRSRLNECARACNAAFGEHRYHEAANALYHFWWDEFCDWYLEFKKSEADWSYAYVVYEQALRLLHPVMPFITEELWQRLKLPGKSIALARYPQFDAAHVDTQAELEVEMLRSLVTGIRARRAEAGIDPKQLLRAEVTAMGSRHALIVSQKTAIERLASVQMAVRESDPAAPHGSETPDSQAKWSYLGPDPITPEARVIPYFGAVLNIPVNRERIEKENAQLEKLIAEKDRQLANDAFLRRAPEHVIAEIRQKRAQYEAQLNKNRAALR
ncbi:MAG TPA: valine--tRNA ligase [Bryobacteraceae bacterium]|nr:valine--tRNA ligase [Bryobacteraceae bacterium]